MSSTAVVIVSYRSEAEAAASARSVSEDPEVAEVLIVDNSADEQRVDRVAFEGLGDRVTVISAQRNLGYAAGNNLGIRAAVDAGHEFVLVLNPDVDPAPGTVRALLDVLLADDAVQIVSPALVETYRGDADTVLRSPGFDLLLGRGLLTAPRSGRFESTFFGAAFLARSRCFEQHGVLDEDLFLYCEEVEFVSRMRRHGERPGFRVAADVHVQHGRGGTVSPDGYEGTARSTVAYEQASRSVIVFGRKYHRRRVWLWTLARLVMAARLAVRDRGAATAVVRGLVAGLRVPVSSSGRRRRRERKRPSP
ncbi:MULTISPECIES: glycosyltransferase [unclassified Curtobacterium]|uniref:glycosyltransferase n=1 Tax=unclassified Curtobacterium TaxID=257496 RepID=UPI0008DD7B5B|nr:MULTISPECIES: glycosyltransferase family 2 protein [unclassified Curtobacterium]OIH95731.1 hypothetical protein BIU92_04315 [Curtobacterium sp. MCBA15_003]OII31300.1 hypothetical protein BIU94_04870 [Curtobacterium sp. MMLR14_006]